MSVVNAQPSWKTLGGWIAGAIIVVGVIFVLSQTQAGRELLGVQQGRIPAAV